MLEEAMPEWLTIDEAADYLRKPVETLRKWRTQGYGPPAAKTGRSLLYRKAGIDKWLAERELESGRGRAT
jgi:excisionase family DNA binding protein